MTSRNSATPLPAKQFTDEHHQFRKVVREFFEREINPHVAEWEEAGMMPLHAIFKQMGDLGFLGLEYDPEFGGQGADHLFTVILAEEAGRAHNGSIGMALGVQTDMATPSLGNFGTAEQKERFLAPALRGDVRASRPGRCAMVTSGSSTDRRCTSRTACKLTGCASSSGPPARVDMRECLRSSSRQAPRVLKYPRNSTSSVCGPQIPGS